MWLNVVGGGVGLWERWRRSRPAHRAIRPAGLDKVGSTRPVRLAKAGSTRPARLAKAGPHAVYIGLVMLSIYIVGVVERGTDIHV
jgi:hypothetical protein